MLPQPCRLVLDDYHLILNQNIHRLVDTFIQYLPSYLHLVLITGHDPSLDIDNLRARNQVNEIRFAELRFSVEETQQYLRTRLGGNVPLTLAYELFQRAEGWAAALRLAELAVRHQVDPDRSF